MISVHYYSPWDFAGSGETTQWGEVATDKTKVSSWGQEDYMKGQFEKLKTTFVEKGYPVVIGEYGATDITGVDADNQICRKYWYKSVCELALEVGCVPVTWDNNGHNTNVQGDQFGLFERRTKTATKNGQEIIDSIMSVYGSVEPIVDPTQEPSTEPTKEPAVTVAPSPASPATKAAAQTPAPTTQTDGSVIAKSGKIKINIANNKTYSLSKKVVIRATLKLKKVSINSHAIKAGNKKKLTFKLAKYKKFLKNGKKKNIIKITDGGGNTKKVKFMVK